MKKSNTILSLFVLFLSVSILGAEKESNLDLRFGRIVRRKAVREALDKAGMSEVVLSGGMLGLLTGSRVRELIRQHRVRTDFVGSLPASIVHTPIFPWDTFPAFRGISSAIDRGVKPVLAEVPIDRACEIVSDISDKNFTVEDAVSEECASGGILWRFAVSPVCSLVKWTSDELGVTWLYRGLRSKIG